MGAFDYLLEPDNPPASAVDPLAEVPDATGVNGDMAATEAWKPKYQPASTLLGMDLPDNVLPSGGDYALPRPQRGAAAQPTQQQPSNVDEYNALVKQYAQNGINPLAAYLDELKPDTKPDEQRAERLKKIAAINSIGKALATVGEGVYGSQGAPIFRNEDKITFPALQGALEAQDKVKQEKNRFALMQLQNDIQNLSEAKRMAADEMGKKWTVQQQEAARKAGREEWDRQYGIKRGDELADYERNKSDEFEQTKRLREFESKLTEAADNRRLWHDLKKIAASEASNMRLITHRSDEELRQLQAKGFVHGASSEKDGVKVSKDGVVMGYLPKPLAQEVLTKLSDMTKQMGGNAIAQDELTNIRAELYKAGGDIKKTYGIINKYWPLFFEAINVNGGIMFKPRDTQGTQEKPQTNVFGDQIGGNKSQGGNNTESTSLIY